MAFEKITDADLEGKGNVGKPDTPGVDTSEMQRILDEIPRDVIVPKFNSLLDALQDALAASFLGANIPNGLPEETGKNVQNVIQAVYNALNDHKSDETNPHNVTAAQTGAYTRTETDTAINEKVQQIGAGDMAMSVYDKKGLMSDIYEYTDESCKKTEEACAPKAHASSASTYGVGTNAAYGHVKLSDTASTSGASAGVAATPKCVYQSLLPQSLSPTFKNGCTNAGSTYAYRIGRLVVCEIDVELPTISTGKWLTMLTIPTVKPIKNVRGRIATINGGPARDFLITTENSVCVANLYAEPQDSGHIVGIPVSFISSV